jgi:diguanylate cyclase (GGDEF)-like protein
MKGTFCMQIDPLKVLGRIPKSLLIFLSVSLVMLISIIDYVTGFQVSVSFLYLFPIMLIALVGTPVSATLISIFSAITLFWADLASGHIYTHKAIPLWNFITELGVFITFAFANLKIKKLLQREHEFACSDYLTDVYNSRYFYEQARLEINRSARYKQPLTLAYLDIDNFKNINDTYGHSIGDDLLRTVAESMKTMLRATDIISRMGGDEFAILMPDTSDEQAKVVVSKVQHMLLETLKKNGWPVTFSIGVVTCYVPPCSHDDLIKKADNLMYDVKKNGKNMIKFGLFEQHETS